MGKNTYTEAKSVAGTTEEARTGLLRFGSAAPYDCSARHGRYWGGGAVCGKPARWYVGLESADAGMTINGHFNPARIHTNLCDEHLAEVRREPRLVFFAERRNGAARQSNFTVIDVSRLDELLDELSGGVRKEDES